MRSDELRTHANALPEVSQEQSFGELTDVFKVHGKVFAILELQIDPARVTLKCDPELAELQRDQFVAVTPGYHMSKKHWNSVLLDGSIPSEELVEMLHHSYRQVLSGLPKSTRERLRAIVAD